MSQDSNPAAEPAARATIRPVKERVERDLIAQPGVVGVDIAEKETGGQPTGELSIVVFVEKKLASSRVPTSQQIPEEIDGIKTDVQELVIELQAGHAVRLEGEYPLVDPAAYPTLSGGIGIGPLRSVFLSPPDVPAAGNYVFVGTLGAMVRDRASGATMALTNFHVACVNNTWSVGDRMVQPSLVDGGTGAGQFGSLTRAVLDASTDGAVITVDAGKTWSASVTGIGDVNGQAAATIGMAVQKRGRTTEHTFGTVVSTDFSVSIDYGTGVGVVLLTHQVRIQTDTSRSTRFSDHGDSGSVVVDSNRNVVGLLFAGSNDGTWTFANPIQAALDDLGVDLLLAPSIPKLTKPLLACFSTKLTTLCPPETYISRYVICRPSKFTLCPSKFTLCLSKSVLCPTSIPLCDVQISKPVCGPDFPDLPDGPIDIPGGRFGYGQSGDAEAESYWAGYLTALEELAVAEAQADTSTDGQGS